jgi:aryl-alcohol dehydrogenase-like predicted oxidoreductase
MIPQRTLGQDGPAVGAIGYGAMVLEGYYGEADESQGMRTIQHALDVGLNLIDTADAYGQGHNERLVGRAIQGRRDDAFIASKFGIVYDPKEQDTPLSTGWGFSLRISGRPDYARRALDNSLRRLNVDVIDLWYLHYPDPGVPIAETVGAMTEGIKAGKVRYLGLSNVTAEQVRAAHAVHPIAAVQYEYSLWRREAEASLVPALRELGIALVPWSPLGGGFLTGTVDALGGNDFRVHNPKYAGDNLETNRDRFAPLMALARQLEITPAQLALAWLLHQGPQVVPIPGTRKETRIDENAAAAAVKLDTDTLGKIDRLAPVGWATGAPLLV